MSEQHPSLIAFRGCMVAVCLALLAGCLPRTSNPAAPVPVNVVATAGNTLVTLTWTASMGATGYNVKRSSTNGGPYTKLASPTALTYADSSVTNGTAYYYVVSALNAAGESANSAEVSATPKGGTWVDVTPANADLTTAFACGNFGATSVTSDPLHPADIYTEFNCQGIWKSTDYGVTWTGPINTGTNGAAVGDCSGGVTVSPNNTAPAAIVYETCIRGAGLGFWKSVDGGVNWTKYPITPTSRQDYFGPSIDPYDVNHLLLIGHEFDSIVESADGGQTWTSVPLAAGMLTTNQSGSVSFINTGNASGTRGTWLFVARSGGFGTWRTSNAGTSWTQVDKNESGGAYQFDTSGVVFMPGVDSALGNGVLRSTDYGQTWAHVGLGGAESVVFATSKNVYAMFGGAIGPTGSINPNFQVAPQPGTGTWVAPGTPAGLADGAASITVVNDGNQNIFVGAMFNSGVWRYVEP